MNGESEEQRAYWNERLRQHWGAEGAGSVVLGRQFNLWRYRVRKQVFRRLVRQLALQPANLAVLDVGCGTGFYLEQWQSLGVRSLAGLDISDWSVAQLAKAYPNVTFYRDDVGGEVSSLPVGAFDVITAQDVLVHLVDDASYLRALQNLRLALKTGGYLLYSDAFFHAPAKQFENYWKGRSLADVSLAMQACKLEIVTRVPMSVLMSAPTDTYRRELNERIWDAAMIPVRKSECIGFVIGALLFPLELLLVSAMSSSPAIEIMVCRKPNAPLSPIDDSGAVEAKRQSC
ncbi:MAG: class I SAM-dependent methyltransferase [Chloroflexi bacterium]|nr:class I SAM-dependent methyltransferase [Chloroflexota bacterium]